MPKLVLTNNTVILVCDSETDASHVHAALDSHQWVRMQNGCLQIANVGPEPTMSDHERLVTGAVAPCFPIPDGKSPVPVQQHKAPHEPYAPGCYVKHIGAGIRDRSYERLYNLMVSVGFSLLRSPRGTDNKYWEVWYLPGLWALTGPLKDAPKPTVVKWMFDNVAPGNLSFDGEAWALSFE